MGSGDTCWCRTGLIYVCCPGGIINSALLPSKANEVESKLYGYLMQTCEAHSSGEWRRFTEGHGSVLQGVPVSIAPPYL